MCWLAYHNYIHNFNHTYNLNHKFKPNYKSYYNYNHHELKLNNNNNDDDQLSATWRKHPRVGTMVSHISTPFESHHSIYRTPADI